MLFNQPIAHHRDDNMNNKQAQKEQVALAALRMIDPNQILGVGTGSTVNCLIAHLGRLGLKRAVASSKATQDLLIAQGVDVISLNDVEALDLYIDGADEIDARGYMIKGGGGALTREKMVAAASKRFVCLVDESKVVARLGAYPLPIEVLPDARSYVARQIVKLGGVPEYRQGVITDYGNLILDIHHFWVDEPLAQERLLESIIGVVSVGIFAHTPAHSMIVGGHDGARMVELE